MGAMAHRHDLPVPTPTRQILNVVAAVLALVTLLGMVVLRPDSPDDRPDLEQAGAPSTFYDAEVTGLRADACQNTPAEADIKCELATLRLLEGPDQGVEVDIDFPESQTTPDPCWTL
jgi:hypothetical protein